MNSQGMNLFIVESDKRIANTLEQSLYNRFGKSLNISTFYTGESCLEKIDSSTNFVVLAYFLGGMNGNEILKSIKTINPKTEVVMLSSNDDVVAIVESLHEGATDYLIKGDKAWRRLVPHVYRVISEPIRRLGNEFGAKAYIAMFLTAFIFVGLVSFTLMKIFSY